MPVTEISLFESFCLISLTNRPSFGQSKCLKAALPEDINVGFVLRLETIKPPFQAAWQILPSILSLFGH